MDVRNCRTCGRLFNYLTGPSLCESCKAALEDKFEEVKEYVRDHRDAPINQVSEDCDVSVKQIKQWIREERLILTEGSGVYIECESCGAPIRTGRFCESCKNRIAGDLQSAYAKPVKVEEPKKQKRDGNRMRFLDT